MPQNPTAFGMRGFVALAATTLVLISFGASAQPKHGHRGGPPAEALAACQASSAGDQCSFSGRRGSVSGSCWAPANKPLACRPANAPKRGSHGETEKRSQQ